MYKRRRLDIRYTVDVCSLTNSSLLDRIGSAREESLKKYPSSVVSIVTKSSKVRFLT